MAVPDIECADGQAVVRAWTYDFYGDGWTGQLLSVSDEADGSHVFQTAVPSGESQYVDVFCATVGHNYSVHVTSGYYDEDVTLRLVVGDHMHLMVECPTPGDGEASCPLPFEGMFTASYAPPYPPSAPPSPPAIPLLPPSPNPPPRIGRRPWRASTRQQRPITTA